MEEENQPEASDKVCSHCDDVDGGEGDYWEGDVVGEGKIPHRVQVYPTDDDCS